MRTRISLTLISMLLLATACTDPAADQTRAVTCDAAKVSPTQTVSGQKYQITPQNSKIEFTGSKVTGSHNGGFQQFSGEVDYAGDPQRSQVNITIQTDSITTDDDSARSTGRHGAR